MLLNARCFLQFPSVGGACTGESPSSCELAWQPSLAFGVQILWGLGFKGCEFGVRRLKHLSPLALEGPKNLPVSSFGLWAWALTGFAWPVGTWLKGMRPRGFRTHGIDSKLQGCLAFPLKLWACMVNIRPKRGVQSLVCTSEAWAVVPYIASEVRPGALHGSPTGKADGGPFLLQLYRLCRGTT